jgi:non-canonical purine NTP pyrophosphatase (RdgB/HAM1 family)
MKQLVFATNNAHKVEEVSAKLKGALQLLTLNDINCHDDIEETGLTFSQNASLKSRYVFDKFRLNCFGDDSGLEIDALNGEPGSTQQGMPAGTATTRRILRRYYTIYKAKVTGKRNSVR